MGGEVSIMNEDLTLGDKKEETTPSVAPTDNKVPNPETENFSSDKTLKTETEGFEDTTTVKPGGVDDEHAIKSRAQQRIGELIRKNKALQAQLEGRTLEEDTENSQVQPSGQAEFDSPEVARAKEFLKGLGFVAKEDVKQQLREEISNLEAKMVLEDEHNRLSRIYNGEDGRPKYDREAVMEHIRKTGIYNPEAAYKDLHEAELIDWAIKQALKAGSSSFREKPSSATAGETGEITAESLSRILQSPEGRRWYEENRDKILSALQRGELQ
jgi:hypothetical protein